jgi:hypothetical protein
VFCLLLIASRATNLNHTLTALLRELSERVNEEDKQKIGDALENVCALPYMAHKPHNWDTNLIVNRNRRKTT